jgi:hypothetical protein
MRFAVAPPGKPSTPHAASEFLIYRTGIIATRCRNIAATLQRRIHD